MKTKICFSIFIFILTIGMNDACAQAPSCEWALSASGSYLDKATSITTDIDGNVIITGHFYSSTLTFDTITLDNHGNSGSYDILLAKFNADGDILWARNFGNSSMDESNSVATDSFGNIYITGYFIGATLLFDSVTLTSNGWREVFLAKVNPSGNVIWAKSAGGNRYDEANALTIDNSGNVYITGYYASPVIHFESDSLLNTEQNPIPHNDIFFAKYDHAGSLIWVKNIGGESTENCFSITSDINGNVYLAGTFWSPTLYFDSDSLDKQHYGSDFFLIKYNASGNAVWANSGGGDSQDTATTVVTDNHGNVYVGGCFKSPVFYFNGNILYNYNYEPYSPDIFLIKYDEDGVPAWGNSIGGWGDEELHSLTTGPSESIILSGYFNTNSIIVGPDTLINNGWGDIVLACYNEDGSYCWSKSLGNDEAEVCYDVHYDQDEKLYLSGAFGSQVFTLDSITLENSNYYSLDLFVAQLNMTTTGMRTEEQPLLTSIFPNPSSDDISIDLPGNSELNIIDVNGQVIRNYKAAEGRFTMNISDLPKGLYFLRIMMGEKILIKKFIKQQVR